MIYKIIALPPSHEGIRALFLDRDGVINKKPPVHDYVKTWSEFKFNPGIFEIVRFANSLGLTVIIITNQQGIGLGLMADTDFSDITDRMIEEFKKQNCAVSAVYYCPHKIEENCLCRKPNPGLIDEAVRDYHLNLASSFMIGDSAIDVKTAQDAGVGHIKRVVTDSVNDFDYQNFLKE